MSLATFRYIAAEGNGSLVRAYMTENRPEEDPGNRVAAKFTGNEGRAYWRVDMPRAVSEALGIDPTLRPKDEELDLLYEGRRADTGERWTHHKRKHSAIDICFGFPKPVTLACQFAQTEAECGMLWLAMDRVNDKGMRFVAADMGWARQGHGGEDGSEPGAVGWTTFRHEQARPTLHAQDGPDGITYLAELAVPGDPHCHYHNSMYNVVVTAEGRICSLDTQRLTDARLKLWGAYAQAELAQELRTLGIRVGVDKSGQAVALPAIPEKAAKVFSKGGRQTERNAKRLAAAQGEDWAELSAERKLGLMAYAKTHERVSKAARTGAKAEGKTPQDVWEAQAEAIGWRHQTVLEGILHPVLTDAQRYEAAYAFAAVHLAEEFRTNAVLDRDMMAVWAARGLIGAGIKGPQDIFKVVSLIEQRGLTFQGEHAKVYTAMVDGRLRVANSVQVRIEERVAELASAAAKDRSGALTVADIQAAIQRTGVNFSGKHGEGQEAAVRALATGGAVTYLTGVAGAGKSYLLRPLVDAYRHDTQFDMNGRDVIGCATGWVQADAMKAAGVKRTFAVAPLLEAIEAGEFKPTRNTVLIVEELSQIGPAEFLRLLELQAKTGFTMKCIGDGEQCQSISAGSTVEILARVLPEADRPQLLTTVRQKRDRDKHIAGLFRDGEAKTANDMKREDGTIRMLGGDRDEVVGQIADWMVKRRDVLLASGFKKGITGCALTNAEAAEISTAVRARLKARGEIKGDDRMFAAMDQRGETYDLPLAVGDRVRLFRKTYAVVDGERGFIGSNGDVLTVQAIMNDGLVLKDKDGRVGVVEWKRLRLPGSDRLLLGHGWCQTVDAIQGVTSDEHVWALPRGSVGLTKYKNYVAESRAEWSTWTFVSEAALFDTVRNGRALGDTTPITSEDLWDRLAEDMSRAPEKRLGMDLVEAARDGQVDALRRLAEVEHRIEALSADGYDFGDEHQERMRGVALRRAAAATQSAAVVPQAPQYAAE